MNEKITLWQVRDYIRMHRDKEVPWRLIKYVKENKNPTWTREFEDYIFTSDLFGQMWDEWKQFVNKDKKQAYFVECVPIFEEFVAGVSVKQIASARSVSVRLVYQRLNSVLRSFMRWMDSKS